MTREETKRIINAMMSMYPNYHPMDLSAVVDIWATIFEQEPYDLVSTALGKFIATDLKGFAPSPGQLKEMMIPKDELEPMEAWAMVAKAIGRASVAAEDDFNSFPPAVQRAVGSPRELENWGQMDSKDVHTVIQSLFIKSYSAAVIRNREEAKIPPAMKNLIGQTMERMITV